MQIGTRGCLMLFRQPFFMRTAILPLSRTDESVGSRGMPADLSRSYFFRLLFGFGIADVRSGSPVFCGCFSNRNLWTGRGASLRRARRICRISLFHFPPRRSPNLRSPLLPARRNASLVGTVSSFWPGSHCAHICARSMRFSCVVERTVIEGPLFGAKRVANPGAFGSRRRSIVPG